jgi:hypothetical protein
MIEAWFRDRVPFPEEGLEEAAVRVEARRVEDRVLRPEEGADLLLQGLVEILGSADEADRAHSEPVGVDRLMGRRDDLRVR